jgi:hypothetical protein
VHGYQPRENEPLRSHDQGRRRAGAEAAADGVSVFSDDDASRGDAEHDPIA